MKIFLSVIAIMALYLAFSLPMPQCYDDWCKSVVESKMKPYRSIQNIADQRDSLQNLLDSTRIKYQDCLHK